MLRWALPWHFRLQLCVSIGDSLPSQINRGKSGYGLAALDVPNAGLDLSQVRQTARIGMCSATIPRAGSTVTSPICTGDVDAGVAWVCRGASATSRMLQRCAPCVARR